MTTFIKYDGVSFNADKVKKMSLQEFISHPMHHNHYLRLKHAEKEKLLTAAYHAITGITKRRRGRGR